jgi:uncharacterized protein
MQNLVQKIAAEIGVQEFHAANVIKLMFEEDCTIPFVARYRKEMTGSMDEVKLRDLRDRYTYLQELEATKERYLKVVEEQCNLKPELKAKFPALKAKFMACETKQELEDLYLPFKAKRRTRAQIAKEKGLEPLLDQIISERATLLDLEGLAQSFVTPADSAVEKHLFVNTAAEALVGAADILAERTSETAKIRASVREMSQQSGLLTSLKAEGGSKETEIEKKKREENSGKYQNYFEFKEPVKTAVSHRVMAIFRGEKEGILRIGVEVDAPNILAEITGQVIPDPKCSEPVKQWLSKVSEDAYRRLISPSIETELRMELKKQAEEEAIKVFSTNLENLLLLPPIPNKTVLGVDPGIRTGSKLVVVDETGKLLDSATVYPTPGKDDSPKTKEAMAVIAHFLEKYKVGCIAVGNGTGSREIDQIIIATMKARNLKDIKRVIVNEAGASVYSTDDIAREEFPDLDPTIRSAVSIARRLQDPLAELVKIDPRSIGVGQYQHDCNVTKLSKSLGDTVESCVNRVGVNVNTASYKLLHYVSGIGQSLAKNIVSHRDKVGKFSTRAELKKVSGFGPKAFEQSAGFLRVPDSENPLDNSGVHPERYDIVTKIATDLNLSLGELIGKAGVVHGIKWEKYVSAEIGMPTLQDIASELIKPGRDPREDGSRLMFSDDVTCIEDLKIGMKLPGTVTNVTNFGAFVDIGVHQDGLVHISELSDDFVRDAASVVAVGNILSVRVTDIDVARRRISLSCKTQTANAQGGEAKEPVGQFHKPGASRNQQQAAPKQRKPTANDDRQTFTASDLLAKFNGGGNSR